MHDGCCCRAGALDALLLPQRQHIGAPPMPQRQHAGDLPLAQYFDAVLLPQRNSAEPRDAALQAAVSTARLAQLLLISAPEICDETTSPLPTNQKGSPQMVLSRQKASALYDAIQWQLYTPWVCQPYCLNPADHSQGRFPRVPFSSSHSWLQYIPTSMALAGKEAAEAVDEARESVLPDCPWWPWYFNTELTPHLRSLRYYL